MWVKGTVRWNDTEVLNDSKKWHNMHEYDCSLYIDGKLTHRLILNSDDKFEVEDNRKKKNEK